MVSCLDDLRKHGLAYGAASGRHLPLDAGHFQLCNSFDASNYFMTTMLARERRPNTTANGEPSPSMEHGRNEFGNYFGDSPVLLESERFATREPSSDISRVRDTVLAASKFRKTMLAGLSNHGGESLSSFAVKLGLCVPSSCTQFQLKHLIEENPQFLAELIGPVANKVAFHNVKPTSIKDSVVTSLDTPGLLAVALVLALVAATVLSTAYMRRKNKMEERERWWTEQAEETAEHANSLVSTAAPSSIVSTAATGSMVSTAASTASTLNGSIMLTVPSTMLPDSRVEGDMINSSTDFPIRRKPASIFIQAWSLVGKEGTLTKLFDCSAAQKPTDSLNGVRVLSMFWIILGHTFLMPTGISGYMNIEDIVGMDITTSAEGSGYYAAEGDARFMFIISAENAVDTFFFMSGFLLSFLMVKELGRAKKKTTCGSICNIIKGIFFRYIRLTPSLAFVLLIFVKVLYAVPYGPFAAVFQESITARCNNQSPYTMLLYLMNFIPFDSNQVCMGWTWYLGDDMIFFMLASIIVTIYCSRKFLGICFVIFLTLTSLVVTTELIYVYDLSPYIFDSHYQRYSYYAYSKPYCRVGAYLIELVTAWIILEVEARRKRTETTRSTSLTGQVIGSCKDSSKWTLFIHLMCFLAAAVLVFIIVIPITDCGTLKNTWSPEMSNLLLNFGRIGWALSFAILFSACYFGYLPTVNRILGHPMWTPLTRLTYGAYLCHPLVIKVAAGNAVQFYTWSYTDLSYRLIGNIGGAYLTSLSVWCLVERPVMTLTSALLKKGTGQKETRKETKGEHADKEIKLYRDKGALAVYFRDQGTKC